MREIKCWGLLLATAERGAFTGRPICAIKQLRRVISGGEVGMGVRRGNA